MSFSSLLSLLLLCSATLVLAQQKGQTSSHFPLSQVLVGEEALLNIQTFNEELSGNLVASEESALEFRALPRDILGSQTVATNIGVSSSLPGVIKVPSFSVPLESGEKTSNAFELEAFPQDVLEWRTLNIDSKIYQVGIALLHPSGTIYAGQSIPLTAKILLPTELPIRSIGIAELEKDNIGAWRMEAPLPPNYNQRVSPRNPNALQPRQIQIGNKSYQVINYTTFASPLKDGPVTLGPGKTQGLQVQVTSQSQRSRGFFSSFSRSYNLKLEIPQTTFSAKPLPKGAPPEFRGAVGTFDLQASIDITNELKPGDPVLVDLKVSGKGNLDTLASPLLDAPESHWKVYPPSRNGEDNDRRTNQGSTSFTQILRPLVPIKEVPAFTLSYFDPKTASYRILRSEPIPLNLSPLSTNSTNTPEAGLVPIAEMTDILGLIEPKPFQASRPVQLSLWWQVLPALLVASLGYLLLKRQLNQQRQQKDSSQDELKQNLKKLEQLTEANSFLRTATHLAETNGLENDHFLQELCAERDRNCFQLNETPPELSSSRRKEILTGLKKRLSQIIILLSLLAAWSPLPTEAFHNEAQAAWDNGNYQEALDAYQLSQKDSATPDLHFNIGNCYYRLEQPGLAGLHYQRALKLDPHHPESLQNLSFLERVVGTIPSPNDERPLWAQKLSLTLLNHLLLAIMWLFLIALLIRFVRPTSRIKNWSTAGLITSTFLALLLGTIHFFHPGSKTSTPPSDAIFVGNTTTEVRTEPSAAGSSIFEINPATTCHILAVRGDWSYIELPDRTRGWVSSTVLEKI